MGIVIDPTRPSHQFQRVERSVCGRRLIRIAGIVLHPTGSVMAEAQVTEYKAYRRRWIYLLVAVAVNFSNGNVSCFELVQTSEPSALNRDDNSHVNTSGN